MKYWVKSITFIVLEFPLQEKKKAKKEKYFFPSSSSMRNESNN